MNRIFLFILFSCCVLTSCCKPKFNYCVEGVDEFVIDSYRIRQGKLSILEMQGIELCCLPEDAMDEYKDYIYEDDVLNIVVYHPSRRDLMEAINYINSHIGFRVVDGCIDIPDILAVEVAGLTLEEARQAIQDRYREQVSDIEVFVDYRQRLYHKVDLAGAVALPSIPVDGKLRLFDALSIARVPTHANFFKSYVSRDGCALAIDMQKLMVQGDMCENIVLKGGDKIFIADPLDSRAMVMGEVMSARPVPLPYGYMSIREAIVAAGGIIQFRGDRNCILVIRGGLVNPKVYLLSWEHIIQLPNESLLLMPGDTVYVSTKPITQWNDFMTQLLLIPGQFAQGYGFYRQVSPL